MDALFSATYGRSPQYKQSDWLWRVWTALRPGIRHDGEQVLRSVPQLASAMGLPYSNVRDARDRYRNQFMNSLGYLVEMGLVEGRQGVLQANGAGRGILTRVPAGVAQSVGTSVYDRRPSAPPSRRQAERRGSHPEPRSSSSRRFSPPSGEPATPRAGAVSSKASLTRGAYGGASVRARQGRWQEVRDRARASERARAALTLRKQLGFELRDSAEQAPWLAAAPVTSVARALMEQLLPEVAPKIKAHRQRQLEAAARRLDRYADIGAGRAGAWIEHAIDVLEGGWRRYLSEPPRSLGALALCLRRLANEWRYHAVVERAGAAQTERGAGIAQRQAVARARFMRRERGDCRER